MMLSMAASAVRDRTHPRETRAHNGTTSLREQQKSDHSRPFRKLKRTAMRLDNGERGRGRERLATAPLSLSEAKYVLSSTNRRPKCVNRDKRCRTTTPDCRQENMLRICPRTCGVCTENVTRVRAAHDAYLRSGFAPTLRAHTQPGAT